MENTQNWDYKYTLINCIWRVLLGKNCMKKSKCLFISLNSWEHTYQSITTCFYYINKKPLTFQKELRIEVNMSRKLQIIFAFCVIAFVKVNIFHIISFYMVHISKKGSQNDSWNLELPWEMWTDTLRYFNIEHSFVFFEFWSDLHRHLLLQFLESDVPKKVFSSLKKFTSMANNDFLLKYFQP